MFQRRTEKPQDFDSAVDYVAHIKRRLNDPQKYLQFLDILQS